MIIESSRNNAGRFMKVSKIQNGTLSYLFILEEINCQGWIEFSRCLDSFFFAKHVQKKKVWEPWSRSWITWDQQNTIRGERQRSKVIMQQKKWRILKMKYGGSLTHNSYFRRKLRTKVLNRSGRSKINRFEKGGRNWLFIEIQYI